MNPEYNQDDLGSESGNNKAIGLPALKVLGLGGGGSNAVNRMIELGIEGVEFIAANTDAQALSSSLAPTKIQIGPRVTRGLGAGGDPKLGAAAALESNQEIRAVLDGADMVFITAGMGGGTGTGAAPIAAEIAREVATVVVGVVTLPFDFEMSRRDNSALAGVELLRPHTHTLITVPNERLLSIVPQNLSLDLAFRLADDVLRQSVQGVAELVTTPGLINVDFAHVREMMLRGGGAIMAIGLGEGDEKARNAIHQALNHPLLEIDSLDQCTGVLVHFTGGEDLTLFEIQEAVESLREELPIQADIVMGATTDAQLMSKTQVILIITGLAGQPLEGLLEENIDDTFRAEVTLSARESVDLDLPAFIRRRAVLGA